MLSTLKYFHTRNEVENSLGIILRRPECGNLLWPSDVINQLNIGSGKDYFPDGTIRYLKYSD